MTDPRLQRVGSQEWMETHPEPFVLIDADYRIVAANAAYSRAYGAPPSAIVGRKCHQVSHRSDEPCHRHGENCPHRTVFTSGRPAQVVHVHFDAAGKAERVRLSASKLTLADGSILMSESVQRLSREVDDTGEMIGASAAYRRLLEQLSAVSPTDIPVLLTGETGSGKELAARFIHRHSRRASGPLVVIDCTAIPEALFEAELFGHEKGAFTGPSSRRLGLVEEAQGGTLFLDEVGELPLPVQAKLLRFADRGDFRRLGSNHIRHVDCRLVAATHRPLQTLISEGSFRRDLFFRLAGTEIRVPSLAERERDVLLIADAVLEQMFAGSTWESRLTDDARRALLSHRFAGNVRELRHVLQRAVQAAAGSPIEAVHLGLGAADVPIDTAAGAGSEQPGAAVPYHAASLRSIGVRIRSLCSCGLPRREVARRLGVSERTVYRHLARQDPDGVPPGGAGEGGEDRDERGA
jgi:DNA-binding NtrC family response regulator